MDRAAARRRLAAPTHNRAELSVQAWDGHLADEVEGPTISLEVTAQVPLADSECGPIG